MKSREQLVLRALQALGVVGAGQQASAEDAKVVDDEVVPVLSDLARRNIYNFGDPDQVEEDAFVHLARILANSTAEQFGLPQSDETRLYAEGRLRELRAVRDAGDPIPALYF